LFFVAFTALGLRAVYSEPQDENIVGGTTPDENDPIARRTVLLVSQLKNKPGFYFCTGDSLPNHIVLTAAHCLEPETQSIQVFFGSSWSVAQARPFLTRDAISWKANENYLLPGGTQVNDDNDIGILKFAGDAPPGSETFFLPEAPPDLSQPHIFLFAGYGAIDAQGDGSQILRTSFHLASDLLSPVTGAQIFMSESTTGTCFGDSGGPLVVYFGNRFELLGVNSRGIRNSPCVGGSSAYTGILNQKQWIEKTIPTL
jgi:secreted trypsin-like serine protease